MSFFSDILKSFNVDDLKSKTTLTFVLGVGIVVVGKVKILSLGEEKIVIGNKKQKITIFGQSLLIKSMAKGEIVVGGEINNIAIVGGK